MEVDGTRPLSIDTYSPNYLPQMTYPNFSVYGHYAKGISGDVFTDEVWARPDRPYGQGEYIWKKDNTKRGFVWFGTSAQAMRFKGASDTRPYTLLSAWVSLVPGVNTSEVTLEQSGNPLFGENNMPSPWTNPIFNRVQAGFHPVLVADSEYWAMNSVSDAEGTWPVSIPILQPGKTTIRTLNLFNDTFNGTSVEVRWQLRKDSATGQILASNSFTEEVPMGYVKQSTIEVPVPALQDGTALFLVLAGYKNGVEQFRESSQRFQVMNVVQLKGGVPFGSSPAYKAGNEFDKASDGNLETFFDYLNPDGGMTGIDLGPGGECRIGMIQFSPRSGNANRMIGGVFEGSMDDVNYEPLATVSSAPASTEHIMVTNPRSYRYLRYRSPSGSYGNIAEMAFFVRGHYQLNGTAFGNGPAYKPGFEFEKASDGNPDTFYDYVYANGGVTGIDLGVNGQSQVSLIQFSPRVGFAHRMVGGVFEGSQNGTTYVPLATVTSSPVANQQIVVTNTNAYRYLRYRGPNGSYGNIAEMVFFVKGYTKLQGLSFGTTPSYGPGFEFDKAVDGNAETFFDYANANGGYTGIDLGAGNGRRVSFIQFAARKTFPARMTGGVFEGSVDGVSYHALATLSSSTRVERRVPVTDPTVYRYLRYRGPSGSYSNIAEMEFIAYDLAPLNAPANLTAIGGDGAVVLSWQETDGVSYRIKRALTQDGPFEMIADSVTGGSFTDTSGTVQYHYELYPLSEGGEGAAAKAAVNQTKSISDWRLANFNTTSESGDSADDADPDHDLQTNRSEFIAGTDPHDGRSVLKFSSIRVDGNDMVFGFPTVPFKVYQLMQSPDLSHDGWTQVGSNIVGDGSVMEMRDTDAVNGPALFYRLNVIE